MYNYPYFTNTFDNSNKVTLKYQSLFMQFHYTPPPKKCNYIL